MYLALKALVGYKEIQESLLPCCGIALALVLPRQDNATVHRAAANDIDFRSRVARVPVCHGLLGVLIQYGC